MKVLRLATAGAVLALAACGAPAPRVPMPQDDLPAGPARTGAAGYEQRLNERAQAQGRQGRLAEAALSWEILTVLRPDSVEYRDRLAETRRLVDGALADSLHRAAQASRRNDLDAAATHYLAALALQPDNAQTAEALRGIERERNRRSYLGKPSRLAQTRRAGNEPRMAGPAPAVPLDRNEVEHAAMLVAQGEYDDAIGLLERHVALDKRDTAACRLLADTYLQKGEKLLPGDKAGALSAFEKSARIDPTNPKVAAWLKQLRGGGQVSILPAASASARSACSLK